MSKQGIKISTEESLTIQDMLKEGISGSKIAKKLNRSKNAVAEYIRDNNLTELNLDKQKAAKSVKKNIEHDYASLPDDVLFDHKKYPSF